MLNKGRWLVSAASALVLTLGIGAVSARQAEARKLLLLLDATGSMTQPCSGPAPCAPGLNRFDIAKVAAKERLQFEAAQPGGISGGVAIYLFYGTTVALQTAGFVPVSPSLDTLIDSLMVTSQVTPLADAMCTSIDALLAAPGLVPEDRLSVLTDGDENSSTGPCAGPYSSSIYLSAPFEAGSWQNKVWARTQDINGNPRISVDITLFTPVDSLAAGSTAPTKRAPSPELSTLSFNCSQLPCVTDAEFFSELASDTNGRFINVRDDQAPPVFGDVDGDLCVSRGDSMLVALQFGNPVIPAFDVVRDGAITYADYAFVLARIGLNCAQAPVDPYVTAEPMRCTGKQLLTIDGKAISSSRFPIIGDSTCRIVIRNSLIVGGERAFALSGTIRVTIDNSIIIGERGVLAVTGLTKLSAAKSFFFGPKVELDGKLEYTDRGGNVWPNF